MNTIISPIMKELAHLHTKRLILRPWLPHDLELFEEMNADPRVMEYFLSTRNREESAQEFQKMLNSFAENGWGFWAVTLRETQQWIGMIGIMPIGFQLPFTPAVEVGWRLAQEFWGKGYATEGALASLDYGFNTLHINEIVAYTTVKNQRSRHVMEKIGMTRDPAEDFDHPKVPEDHPLRRHVLYRIQRDCYIDQHRDSVVNRMQNPKA